MASGDPMDRRRFWREALRGVLPGLAQEPMPAPRRTSAPEPAPLRPPGALPGSAFLDHCRPECRICVDTCPRYAIIPSLQATQPGGGDSRPYLLPARAACDLCGLCMLACPTDALQVTDPAAVRIGLAVVDNAACVRSRGESCSICLDACPFPGTALREADGFPSVGVDACTGCGLCAEPCPPGAISVVPQR